MIDALKSLFAGTARAVFNGVYRFQCKRQGPRRDKTVVFVSRQMDVPSENFRAVGKALEERGWKVVYHTKRLTKKTVLPYTAHVLQEIALLAQASAVVLDRYDPVVSLLDFTCEEPDNTLQSGPWVHSEFPAQPVVIQLWHAFGSFKKFGYQSLDTPEGHSTATARIFRIHRNYSWVICTGEGDRNAFAEAFSLPPQRVVPLGLPEFDTLLAKREASLEGTRGLKGGNCTEEVVAKGIPQGDFCAGADCAPRPLRVLFAPTLRKDPHTEHPFHDLEAWWQNHPLPEVTPRWSYHPLERGVGAATTMAFGLEEADVVVTDYSSLVYEAFVLGKPVLFYVPDIEAYRRSPGLHADPLMRSPGLCYTTPDTLQRALGRFATDGHSYPQEALRAFVGDAFCQAGGRSAERIADFICEVTNAS